MAAYLLKERGYEVIGVCLKLWQKPGEIEDARAVAEHLGIEFVEVDFAEKFRSEVIDRFASEYAKGRTPNPCVICNHKIKWTALLEKADELGAEYVATGHYARVSGANSAEAQGDDGAKFDDGAKGVSLTQAATQKDQTYALCMVTAEQLSRTLMPLADMTKDEVRGIAAKVGLPTASKSDSMDICFIPDGDYVRFLKDNYGAECVDAEDADALSAGVEFADPFNPGDFVNSEGKILGRHKGIAHYTVGQRRGLGIAADRSLYVIRIDAAANEVILGYEEEVMAHELIATDVNWLINPPQKEIEVIAKIRYNHQGSSARLTALKDGTVKVTFDEPVKAITPGQAAVFYIDGEHGRQLIGGGTIV